MDDTQTMLGSRKMRRAGDSDGGDDGGRGGGPPESGGPLPVPSGRSGGVFQRYKPEQGTYTRTGTFGCGLAVIAWGSYFIWDQLRAYESDDAVSLLITNGIPLLYGAVLGAVLWWLAFANRGAGDFMIATEGEMKKVNWSSRRELIGSTKVVILFTTLFAVFLFVVDVLFQRIFKLLGVLKV
ncbi:MAG: preprotein translocase subunit SecE [Planctomycetota bacterium]